MNDFILLSFLFSSGCSIGWVLEVVFRRFFSANNPEREWINPGFLTGPYLPLYGFGLSMLYLLAGLEKQAWLSDPLGNKLLLFALMALGMTAIEYAAGLLCVRVFKVKLWDYSDCWGNLQGLICPLFSLFWAILGAVYYFLIHPHIQKALLWLSHNLAFSFVIGFFYGVFVLDLVQSTRLIFRLKRFAGEKQILIRYEDLKEHLRQKHFSRRVKRSFFFSMLRELDNEEFMREVLEDEKEKRRDFVEYLRQKLPAELRLKSRERKINDRAWTNQKEESEEWWDIYDSHRRLTGRTHRRGQPLKKGERHLVVHVWLQNERGEFLLTRRAPNKSYPLCWETSGGSALAGEDSLTAALREVKEETGLSLRPEAGRCRVQLKRREYFLDVWLFQQDFDLARVTLCENETCAVRAAKRDEIVELLRRREFVPYEYLDALFLRLPPRE